MPLAVLRRGSTVDSSCCLSKMLPFGHQPLEADIVERFFRRIREEAQQSCCFWPWCGKGACSINIRSLRMEYWGILSWILGQPAHTQASVPVNGLPWLFFASLDLAVLPGRNGPVHVHERVYPWSRSISGSKKREYIAVLHHPPVDSPQAAVRATIVQEFNKTQAREESFLKLEHFRESEFLSFVADKVYTAP